MSLRVGMVLSFALGAGGLWGCAHKPISPSLRHESMKGVTIAQVQQKPDAYRGAVVIWGGRILKVTVTGNGTDLYVVRTPLSSEEWPRSGAYSEGRFIAHSANLLDPSAYRAGRRVTLAGTIAGTQQGKIGSSIYVYPVLDVDQLVLWRRPPPYYAQGYYAEPYWGWYGWPYYWGGDDFGDDYGDDFGDDLGDEGGGFGDEGEGGREGGEGDR